jgi:hypothetical protein
VNPLLVDELHGAIRHLDAPAHVPERVELCPHLTDIVIEVVLVDGSSTLLPDLTGAGTTLM